MKDRYVKMYMDMASRVALESTCVRAKVGCVIVTTNNGVAIGMNGLPEGWDNEVCEIEVGYSVEYDRPILETKDEVRHAERAALKKVMLNGMNPISATVFVTMQPCIHCAGLLFDAEIKTVYYRDKYRCNKGIEFLEKCGVEVIHLSQ